MSLDQQHKAANALEQLRKKLLDLTARNKLLNFRHTKRSCLRITDELPDQLLEVLLDTRDLRFDPVPLPNHEQLIQFGYIEVDEETKEETQVRNKPGASEWAENLGMTAHFELPKSSAVAAGTNTSESAATDTVPARYTDNSIQTLLFPEDLEATLRTLQRKTDLALQEMGTNILYLAFGFLEWYDSDQAEKGRVAPLFLLPVNIRKDKLNAKSKTFDYLISYSGEDITPNLSLREKLKTDFSLALPEMPIGDEISVEVYLQEIENMFRVMYPRWRVLRHATLGFFDFTKLLMYLDLDPERWPDDKPLIGHPVVAQFFGGATQTGAGAGVISEEYEIDKLDNVHDRYPLVFDADSSQHSAIVEVIDGKSLVIEGPPGTGKSQSISNLIAACIADGKRVLFVAEKLAALEVVKRRLDSAGLGDFVLELHSHKTQKRQLLDSIDERLKKRGSYMDSAQIDGEIAKYERMRADLSAYVELINSEWKDTGLSIFEIFTAATRYREISDPLLQRGVPRDENLPPQRFSDLYRPEVRDTQLTDIQNFTHVFKNTREEAAASAPESPTIADHPWYGMHNDSLYAHDTDHLIDSLQRWQNQLDQATSVTARIARRINSSPTRVANSLDELHRLPDQLRGIKMPGNSINPRALARLTDPQVLEQCQSEYGLLENLAIQRRKLLPVVVQNLASAGVLDSRIKEAGDTLSSRLKDDLSLTEVQRITDIAAQIDTRLSEVNHAIANAVTGLPSVIQTQLYDGSENAIRNCKNLLMSVEALDPGLTELRVRYKSIDALKPTILSLQGEIDEAFALHSRVEKVLNTRRLGNVEKLQTLLKGYNSGGSLRWLRGEWRKYRNTLIRLAAHENVTVDQVVAALPDGIKFSSLTQSLENNHTYRGAFGDDYKGINTVIELFTRLVQWHENLHHQWQGQKSSRQWIHALMDMSSTTELNLRNAVQRGALKALGRVENDLSVVRKCVRERDPVLLNQTALVGEAGAILVLHEQLTRSVTPLTDYFATAEITVGDIAVQLEAIESYHAHQQQWQALVVGQSALADVFSIDIENAQLNDERYVQVGSTLAFSYHLSITVNNEAIANYIALNPTDQTVSDLGEFTYQIEQAAQQERQAFSEFQQIGQIDIDQWQQAGGTGFSALESRNYAAIDHKGLLSGWLDYLRLSKTMRNNGLGLLVEQAELGEVDADNFTQAWQGKINDDLGREILDELPDLAAFSSDAHRALQEQFCECDKRLLELQRIRLAARVDRNDVVEGAAGAYVSELTELKLLKHETRKKRRHIPIRQLIARASEALVQLKPCFMMGPLSAAQYLKPGQIEFDLVVMDEASQIKPEDALGVIARGKQLVVVGDPKQLPPTNFFNRTIDDEEEESAIVSEQESILDATVPMFNTRRLRWHYRSRHEKLIAFSNYHFYDDNLVVFPSPARESDDLGISYFKADGSFVNRTNQAEAQQIAEMVRTHCMEYPAESIGVVAMNTNQRELIDATIESLSREDPLFLEAIEKSLHGNEPLFVKNLENVQGDERDVIVISMTYGPSEKSARVRQNFGPINSADGWRRLNVLLTRSRRRMLIYSSMSSSDIVVSPTSSRGVNALRDLLAYLETDNLHKTRHTGRAPDSDFEIDVIHRIEQRGYNCQPQIGVAGFFIDLAVIDPDSPGRFILGIECDGATYHSARSARDRDRLRESVLVGLGWEIRRIWSTDYFKDPDGEINRIARVIERLRARKVPKTDEPAEVSPADHPDEQVPEKQETGQDESDGDTVLTEEPVAQPPVAKTLEEKLTMELNALARESDSTSEAAPESRLLQPDMISALVEYKPVSLDEYNALVPSFLRRSVHQSEVAKLDGVVALMQRVCTEWG